MKYLSQFCIILGFTLAGEALQRLIPLGIPASVYGLVLLFIALSTGLLKLHHIRETGLFLTSILPVLFVAPTVGISAHWPLIRQNLGPIALILLSTTMLTFGISGRLTQALIKKEDRNA